MAKEPFIVRWRLALRFVRCAFSDCACGDMLTRLNAARIAFGREPIRGD